MQGNPCKSEILVKQRKTCKLNREKNGKKHGKVVTIAGKTL
jgi:hypothetical protein